MNCLRAEQTLWNAMRKVRRAGARVAPGVNFVERRGQRVSCCAIGAMRLLTPMAEESAVTIAARRLNARPADVWLIVAGFDGMPLGTLPTSRTRRIHAVGVRLRMRLLAKKRGAR